MRKKFLTVAATAVMTMSMLMSAFADTEKDLIAHYGFDENTKNEVSGEEAKQTGQKFADAKGDTFTYEEGVNGKALVMAKGNTDGFNLNVKAKGDSYTVSVWLKASEFNGFAQPVVWYGGTDQSSEAWVGIWPGLADKWGSGGPVLGGNDAAGSRPAVTAGANKLTTDDVKELYTASNVAKVPAAQLEEYKEPETRKPQLAQKGEFTSTKEDSSSKDEDSDNTMMIVIIAVVVVVVVIVVVAVASSSKKKNKSEE